MNAQSILSGNDYAYHQYRKKGTPFQLGGIRVRALRVFKEKQFGNERDTAFVECFLVDDDGEIKTLANGDFRKINVRARDLSMNWDQYVAELEHRKEEELRRAEAQRAEAELRNKRITSIKEKMVGKGFNLESVEIDLTYGRLVKIRVDEMERWLNGGS
jgi:hypothetical protein